MARTAFKPAVRPWQFAVGQEVLVEEGAGRIVAQLRTSSEEDQFLVATDGEIDLVWKPADAIVSIH